ncbi:MAG TPA: ABC transporter substrate-binding protein [Dehalococcoidia bacterium]|nr:ABC transporter substrate-binding protein [Dehalococcoidia bacterium]
MLPGRLARLALVFGALSLAALMVFSACGGGKKEAGKTPTAGGIDISGVAELKDGKLTVGSDIAYAPIEYYEEGTQNALGLDVDLMAAMADVLGVDVEFQQVADFAGIVGDLKAKRYDVVMSAISITPEREAEIDFIPYFGPVGTGILTQKGNPKGFTRMEDVCGGKVAVQAGTYQLTQVNDTINQTICKDNPIKLQTFPDNPTAVQELILGRVDAELADDPVAAYSATQSPNVIELAVPGFESAPYGIGVRKDSPELKTALEQALQKIRAEGTYTTILKKWGQEEFALAQ